MEEKIYLYYTNDLHSNFSQWPRTAGYLKDMKKKREKRNETYFLVDAGDHMDRVHPISEAFMGKANVQLMNEVGYDIVTIGNNEGITLSQDDLYHLYDTAAFDIVCANLKHMKENPPAWLLESKVIQTKSDVHIGFIGLSAPFNAFYELLGWHLTIPSEELEKQLQKLEGKTDIIILVSHLGITEDQELARRFSEIDVIIGGHTHHLLRTGEYVNHAIITAAGKYCMFAGEVILTWDHHKKQLIHKEAYTMDISDYPIDHATENMLSVLQKEADEKLGEVAATLYEPLEVNWFKNTPVMQEFTNTIKAWTKADVALLNAGLLMDQFPSGAVTYADLHRICPHPINPVVVKLRGDELIEVIRASFKKDFMELKLQGFGFRGEVIGRMQFSGLEVTAKVQEDGDEIVTEAVLSNGAAIDRNKSYLVATADIFTFGRLLPQVAKSEVKQYFLPEFLRDLLVETLKQFSKNHSPRK